MLITKVQSERFIIIEWSNLNKLNKSLLKKEAI